MLFLIIIIIIVIIGKLATLTKIFIFLLFLLGKILVSLSNNLKWGGVGWGGANYQLNIVVCVGVGGFRQFLDQLMA